MIAIRRSAQRGHANHGWLDTRHTFSFANYHDPKHTQFRSLRVINEDVIAPAMGFDTHPHRDMEIITYVVSGVVRHRDSMGHTAMIRSGDVQRISAGSGIAHSEFNGSTKEPVHLVQIWLLPNRIGVTPDYAEKSFAAAAKGQLHLVISGSGRDGSLSLHQDVDLFLAKLTAKQSVQHCLKTGRYGWLQLVTGEIELNGIRLNAGDGAAVTKTNVLKVSAIQPAQLLLFDLV